MALEVNIKGTLSELDQLWSWDKLSQLVHVDYYRRSMVPSSEVFTITTQDLIDAEIVRPVEDNRT